MENFESKKTIFLFDEKTQNSLNTLWKQNDLDCKDSEKGS